MNHFKTKHAYLCRDVLFQGIVGKPESRYKNYLREILKNAYFFSFVTLAALASPEGRNRSGSPPTSRATGALKIQKKNIHKSYQIENRGFLASLVSKTRLRVSVLLFCGLLRKLGRVTWLTWLFFCKKEAKTTSPPHSEGKRQKYLAIWLFFPPPPLSRVPPAWSGEREGRFLRLGCKKRAKETVKGAFWDVGLGCEKGGIDWVFRQFLSYSGCKKSTRVSMPAPPPTSLAHSVAREEKWHKLF